MNTDALSRIHITEGHDTKQDGKIKENESTPPQELTEREKLRHLKKSMINQ
jgi:hypothetical protein